MELSTYFRINEKNTGQFERTLIIAEAGSYVSYLEGCTAPMRDENQLHAAVVELDSRSAQITAILNELEVSGGEKLGSRVEGFAENKRLTEQRMAQVFEQFERLESIRNDIAKTFANLNSALNKLG